MGWVLDIVVIWLSLDIFLIATGWYVSTVVAPRWPTWWKRVVIDVEPRHQLDRN